MYTFAFINPCGHSTCPKAKSNGNTGLTGASCNACTACPAEIDTQILDRLKLSLQAACYAKSCSRGSHVLALPQQTPAACSTRGC